MRFSERYGYKPVRKAFQIESMDDGLRNGLWNILLLLCWGDVVSDSYGASLRDDGNEGLKKLCDRLWYRYFKRPLDELDNDWRKVFSHLREYFFSCNWYEVYDFIEFVAQNYEHHLFDKEQFMFTSNSLLEKEMSAYRFVDGNIAPITDQEEIKAIESAIEGEPDPVKTHLRASLENFLIVKLPIIAIRSKSPFLRSKL